MCYRFSIPLSAHSEHQLPGSRVDLGHRVTLAPHPASPWSHHHLISLPPCPTSSSGGAAQDKHQPRGPSPWAHRAGDMLDWMACHGVLWVDPSIAGLKITASESIDVVNISFFGGSCILVLASCLHLPLDRHLGIV